MKFEHLGFLILPNGEIKVFGEFPNGSFEKEYDNYFHTPCIIKVVQNIVDPTILLGKNVVELGPILVENNIMLYANLNHGKTLDSQQAFFYYKSDCNSNQKTTLDNLYDFINSVKDFTAIDCTTDKKYKTVDEMYITLKENSNISK